MNCSNNESNNKNNNNNNTNNNGGSQHASCAVAPSKCVGRGPVKMMLGTATHNNAS